MITKPVPATLDKEPSVILTIKFAERGVKVWNSISLLFVWSEVPESIIQGLDVLVWEFKAIGGLPSCATKPVRTVVEPDFGMKRVKKLEMRN